MPDCIDTSSHRLSAPPLMGAGRHRSVGLVEIVYVWVERARQRHALATLDHRMLRDIGVDPGAVWVELRKPFWRA